MVIERLLGGLFALVGAVWPLAAQRTFPDWTVEPLGLSGVWERAGFVAVGELHGVRPVGARRPRKLPRMASPTIHRIYWCEGDFSAQHVVRGGITSSVKRYLWGAIEPGCKLDQEAHGPLSQVWFIREEAEYLRPVVDAGGPFFFTFHTKWVPHAAGKDSEKYFGSLLLSPSDTGLTPEEYAQSFIKPASLACWILGKDVCIQSIRSLAALDSRELHDAACEFLNSQFRERCPR